MGYTHYWKTVDTPATRQGYLMACPTIAKIVKRYIDILQYECDNAGLPIVNEKMIRFNGIEDEGHETFLFQLGGNDFCKTARKAYDIAVCECLLVLKAFIPAMELNSDGFSAVDKDDFLDGTWDEAIENVYKHYGIKTKKVIAEREVSQYYDGTEKYRDCVNLLCYIDAVDGKLPDTTKKIQIVEVPSKSEPGTTHKVAKLADGEVVCTCKGFEYRKTCRHIREAGF